MKNIIFDSGPIISLATNNLLWVLEELKKKYNGDFYITQAVKKEIVDRPLRGKKYKFEALQVIHLISNGTLKVHKDGVRKQTMDLLTLANNCFSIFGKAMSTVQYSEIEALALAIKLDSDALVIDERTLRWIIEKPEKIEKLLEMRVNKDVKINTAKLKKFGQLTKKVKIIRSTELVTRAFELGLLNKYLPKMPQAKKTLIEALLWGIKLNGCAISKEEIDKLIQIET